MTVRTRKTSYRTRVGRSWRRLRTRAIRVMLRHSEPEMVALGAAIGMFVCVLPVIPFHTVLAVLLAAALGANKLAAAAFVWASNPVFFYMDYVIGKWMLELVSIPARNPAAVGWYAFAGRLTKEVLLPVLVGSLIFGLLCGAVTYLVAVRVVTYYRRRAALRKAGEAQEAGSGELM
jgi:hypothetical protein